MVTELSALSAGTKAVISSLDERDLAAKTRVHQLAKLIGHTSKEVIALLGAVGINVRSAQSTVTREQVAEFRDRVQAADKGGSDDTRDAESQNADTDKEQADKAEAKTPEGDKAEPADVGKSEEDKSEAEDADAGEANVDESAVEETEAEKTDVDTPEAGEPSAEELETGSSDTAEDQEANHISIPTPIFMAPTPVATKSTESRGKSGDSSTSDDESSEGAEDTSDVDNEENDDSPSYRRRRGRRGRGKKNVDESPKSRHSKDHNEDDTSEDERGSSSKRSKKSSDKGKSGDKKDHKHDSNKHDSNKRKDKNKKGRSSGNNSSGNGDGSGEGKQESPKSDEPTKIKGSTRAAAARKRREENKRDKHQTISTAEFQARRDAVHRRMIVRDSVRSDGSGKVTQVAIMEDDQLVEHFVTSERTRTLVGNIYLGRVQNVLASMEAAFVDIGTDRNGVIYSGDIDWRHTRHTGRQRKIEKALKPGDPILVQVTKDSVGHKGPRLTSHISLAGRYLVYVPEGRAHGVSRKLPEPERKRLKKAVSGILPDEGGAIIRTAAEGVDTEDIARDVRRQQNVWDTILEKADELRTLPGSQASSGKGSGKKNSKGGKKGSKPHFDGPQTLHEEPNLLVKVVRDLFNEDFDELIVDGDRSWSMVSSYIHRIAPDLEEKLSKYERQDHEGQDAFGHWGIDKQLKQALDRVVFLPSGGTLVIEKTEAMTVIDVNTGRFTGSSGSLEETVTRNNLEAADEIVRQMRLRDIGGMIVVDFIDMVLEENQELVLRRLSEALAKDRTRHQLGEVTSLGLVQITRKRLGKGLVETFSTPCSECHGRGFIVHDDPILLSSTDDDESDDDSAALQDNVDNDLPEYSFDDDTDDHADDTSSDSKDDRSKGDRSGGGRSKKGHAGKGESGKQSHSGKQGDSDETTTRRRSIEEIAAAAVILADDEDPDEPSGADYLPAAQDSRSGGDDDSSGDKDGRPRRRRRRKATRSSRAQREEQVKADHAESDSAKVNQPESATKHDEETARHADGNADKGSGEKTTRGKKQRGRRHATRRSASQAKKASSSQSKSRNKDASQAKDEHQSQDASRTKSRSKDSGESSSRSRDKKSSSADTSSQHKETYEEAQRQFDRSPRRRRATRGNSRSDVPPEKDNYPDGTTGKTGKTGRNSSNAPDQKQSDKSSADNRSERSDKRETDSHSGSSARKNGRRRARRRASTKK